MMLHFENKMTFKIKPAHPARGRRGEPFAESPYGPQAYHLGISWKPRFSGPNSEILIEYFWGEPQKSTFFKQVPQMTERLICNISIFSVADTEFEPH